MNTLRFAWLRMLLRVPCLPKIATEQPVGRRGEPSPTRGQFRVASPIDIDALDRQLDAVSTLDPLLALDGLLAQSPRYSVTETHDGINNSHSVNNASHNALARVISLQH